MFSFIIKKLNLMQLLMQNSGSGKNSGQSSKPQAKLSPNLESNLQLLKDTMGTSSDIVYHQFNLGTNGSPQAALIMVDGLVDKPTVNNFIIKPLIQENNILPPFDLATIERSLISVSGIKQVTTFNDVIDNCLAGDTILLVNGYQDALVISTRGWKDRGIKEPDTEAVVRGPKEGFTETLRTNTAMIRRKVKNPNLTFETFTLGQRTKTDVCVAYIKEIAKPELIEEIKKRLESIKTDAILESGYIEQFIEDAPFSPFSTIGNTERPDVVAGKLLEGRAAILVDGTPTTLTVPLLFIESFQSAEDYYSRPYYVSVVRSLRFLSFPISILAPSFYVATTTFHQELIPTPLLITMAAAREGTPFPAVLEAILMGVAFEILREAGIRLPRPVGTAISIVGALVIGEAAVTAGLVSAPLIIVVALTAIASFVVPPPGRCRSYFEGCPNHFYQYIRHFRDNYYFIRSSHPSLCPKVFWYSLLITFGTN